MSSAQPIAIRRPKGSTPNLVLPTVDGYTVSHSLAVDNLPTYSESIICHLHCRDSYGFILDERFGLNSLIYREFEQIYSIKLERQAKRWNSMVPRVKDDLVVFPPYSDSVKRALRKGLPRNLRPNAWYYYSGAQAKYDSEPKKYLELLKMASNSANSPLLDQIESEVSHTFANNPRFRTLVINTPFERAMNSGKSGLVEEPASYLSLKRILLAIAYAFPFVGYTSGLNAIAATLLLVTQDEVRSFWIFQCILERLLPTNYYTEMNLGCNIDQEVLSALLAWKLPALHTKLQNLEISLHILTSAWFTHLFVDQLPFETLLRVWDSLLCEGSKVMFRIAFSLFKLHQQAILNIADPFELAAFIRHLPKRQLDAIQLMDVAFEGIGGLSSTWISDERARLLPNWKAKHAVRRFSRVSPAYCHATIRRETPNSTLLTPVLISSADAPEGALKLALEDSMPLFERPEEIEESCCSSSVTSSVCTDFTGNIVL